MRSVYQLLRFHFVHARQMDIQRGFNTKTGRQRTDTDFTLNKRLFRHRNFIA